MLTNIEFKKRSNIIHNNFYNYSMVKYENSHIKIEIICPTHGLFWQLPYVHLQHHGCPKCANEMTSKRSFLGLQKFKERSKIIHNNFYNYSKSKYISAIEKLEIICPIHGSFWQSPYNHFNNHGCPKCGIITTKKATSLGTIKFKSMASKVHNNLYDYSNVKYINSKINIKIICSKHGEFFQNPHDHLCGAGCPSCNLSKGELKIKKWLLNNKIYFISQHKFNNCKNPKTNYPLKFDFYIPFKNILIEYDGEQHFGIGYNHSITPKYLDELKYRDDIKTKYATNNNINLIRISYKEKNKIDEILTQKL